MAQTKKTAFQRRGLVLEIIRLISASKGSTMPEEIEKRKVNAKALGPEDKATQTVLRT